MTLEIIKPGLLTTVQDLGRPGWQRYGVSVGGAMDSLSLRVANLLVGNPEGAAVLEMTLNGAVMKTQEDIVLAVCGADMNATVDGDPLPMWRPVAVSRNRTITFRTAVEGCRTILAFAGGIASPQVLGSRSVALRGGFGAFGGRALQRGNVLELGLPRSTKSELAGSDHDGMFRTVSWFLGSEWRSTDMKRRAGWPIEIRIMPGCEWEQFTDESKKIFLEQWFAMSPHSDRMGFRLSGPVLQRRVGNELLSEAVTMGTIQVPPDGQPIVLMADRQTTGGYPRIAQVAAVDHPLFAQLRPGDIVRFRMISVNEAQSLLLNRERDLDILRSGLSLLS